MTPPWQHACFLRSSSSAVHFLATHLPQLDLGYYQAEENSIEPWKDAYNALVYWILLGETLAWSVKSVFRDSLKQGRQVHLYSVIPGRIV